MNFTLKVYVLFLKVVRGERKKIQESQNEERNERKIIFPQESEKKIQRNWRWRKRWKNNNKNKKKNAVLIKVCTVQEIKNDDVASCKNCSKTCAKKYKDLKEHVTFKGDIQRCSCVSVWLMAVSEFNNIIIVWRSFPAPTICQSKNALVYAYSIT